MQGAENQIEARGAKTENPKDASQPLTLEQKRQLEDNIAKARKDMASFEKQYNLLKTKYPTHFDNIRKKHPQLVNHIDQAMSIMNTLGSGNQNITDREMVDLVDTYRTVALQANQTLGLEQRNLTETKQRDLEAAAMGELPLDTSEISEMEKAQLKKLAEDVYNEFFPESNVDYFARWATGQKKLEGYQKLLLGPANGIESAVSGVISLFNPNTYKDFANAIQIGVGMNMEDWCNTWKTIKFMHENLSASDEIAPTISFLVSIATLVGGVGKIGQIAKKLGYAPKTIATLSRLTRNTNLAGKALPITVMTGLTLPIIDSVKTKGTAVG